MTRVGKPQPPLDEAIRRNGQLVTPTRLEHVRKLITALEAEQAWLEDALGMANDDQHSASGPAGKRAKSTMGEQVGLSALNTIAEVAVFTKTSIRTVNRAISGGDLKALHAGVGSHRGVRISEQAVWDWLMKRRQRD